MGRELFKFCLVVLFLVAVVAVARQFVSPPDRPADCGCHDVENQAVGEISPVASAVVPLAEANWADHVAPGKRPALVVFAAPWCPPCNAYAPTVEAAATKLADEATVGKVDADRSRDLVRQHQVSGLPTTIVFVDGREAARFVGARRDADALARYVRRLVQPKE